MCLREGPTSEAEAIASNHAPSSAIIFLPQFSFVKYGRRDP